MSRRSLAFLLTGLCTAAAMGLAGATQSAATNQAASHPPTLTPQDSGTTQGLIAVSPVNKRVVWASGRGGTFAVTTDGGATWRSGVVPGAELLQFRDVEGVSERVAYLLSIGTSGDAGDFRIYKTIDGGSTWSQQFQNQDPAAFYDCFAFWTPTRGFAQSDSVNGQFPAIRTTNGQTWESIASNEPAALPGESFFASSGTCVATDGKNNAWAVTGGVSPPRVLVTRDGGDTWRAYDAPLRGSPSAGLFSVAFRDPLHGMVGGGDLDPTASPFDQTATSSDGGKTWTVTPQQPNIGTVFGLSYTADAGKASPHGRTVLVTGPGGAAWTPDEGDSWFTLPGVAGYWGVAFGSPQTAWLVGTDGRILRVDF
jgi:photosystem II stability/assembly factor-like uncharacterized protein